jgi:hypothetical protein
LLISYIQDKEYPGWTELFSFFYDEHKLDGKFDKGFYPDFKLEDGQDEEVKNLLREYAFRFKLDQLDI